ncbi:MAG: MG2 domain-containing protein, partial [Planctomycetota bacterium]|nr:MG2 domain-containing protein [Planctomycetota bacterium]
MLNRKKLCKALAAAVLCSIVVFTCFPEAFIRRRELRFVGPHEAAPGQMVSYMVTVVDESSKEPVSGASLTLSLQNTHGEDDRIHGVTDESGSATLTLKVSEKAQAGELAVRIRCNGSAIDEDLQFSLGVTGSPNLGSALLTSDKLLYQPGESIQVRGLYKSHSGQVMTNSPVKFELLNAENTRINFVNTKTNAYGVCFSELTTKKSVPEGRYVLRLLTAQGSVLLGSQKLRIKNYRLPSFRAVVVPRKISIAPGEAVQVSVQGRRANGMPLRPASYTLTLKDSFGSTLDIQRNSNPKSWSSEDSLSLAESFSLGEFGEQRLFIEAELTGQSGEVSRSMAVIYASKQALHVIAMAEGGSLVPEISNQIFVQLTGPGGTPVRGQVSFRTEFNESPRKIETDESGFASFEIVPERTMAFHLQGWSEGLFVENKVGIVVDFLSAGILRCSNYVTKPGDKEKISLRVNPTILGSASEKVLFLIEKDGELISRHSFKTQNGVAEGEIGMPGEPGIYSVVAVMAVEDDFYKAKRRIIVQASEQLQLSLETSKQVLSPGAPLQLTARVKGSKAPTALCIQAVDGALRSLNGLFPFQEKLSQFRFGGNITGRLKRPYAQSALYAGPCSELAMQALSGGQFPTTRRVFGNTAPLNELRARTLRERISRIAFVLFIATLIALVIAAVATFVVFAYRRSSMILLILFVAVMGCTCFSLLSPTLLSAKSRSLRRGALSNLKEISLGGQVYQEEFGPIVTKDLSKEKSDAGGGDQSLRKYFPETLYYSPLVLTDENGEATVKFAVADSLTTWQIDVLASSQQGAVAHRECSVVTKKDMSLELRAPAFLREGDECRVGVTIRNDSNRSKQVILGLKTEDWFELLSPLPQKTLTLKASSSQTRFFTARLTKAGEYQFHCSVRDASSAQSKKLVYDTVIWPMSVRDFEV